METKKELKTYQWKGKNKLGKEISGENDAKNDAVLKAFLAKQGLVNVTVKERKNHNWSKCSTKASPSVRN